MPPTEHFNFSKSDRICSTKRISGIFKDGSVVYCHPLKALFLPNEAACSGVVISVPKRSFKKAVHRNYIKRLIRESLRLNRFQMFGERGYDIYLIFIGKELPQFALINEKVKDVLAKIKKMG